VNVDCKAFAGQSFLVSPGNENSLKIQEFFVLSELNPLIKFYIQLKLPQTFSCIFPSLVNFQQGKLKGKEKKNLISLFSISRAIERREHR
jgi:hypothetical protein